jgi:hypothetical protein
LNNWLRSMPVQVAAAHTILSPEEIAGIPPKANKLVGWWSLRRHAESAGTNFIPREKRMHEALFRSQLYDGYERIDCRG